MNHHRIITISREFGSGGRTIGKKVAENLGVPCYDSELLQKIAEESGFAKSYVKDAGEYAPPGLLASVFSSSGKHRQSRDSGIKISVGRLTTASIPT